MAILAPEKLESAPDGVANGLKRPNSEVLNGTVIDLAAIFRDGRKEQKSTVIVPKMGKLFGIGDDISEIHYLLSGQMVTRRERKIPHRGASADKIDQGGVIVDVIDQGDVIGLDRLQGGTSYSSAIATVECQIISMPLIRLLTLIKDDPSLFQHVMGLFADAEERTTRHATLLKYSYGKGDEILMDALSKFADPDDGKVRLPQEFISERTGAARETTNKKLRKLKVEGKIETVEAGLREILEITIVDGDLLQALANNPLLSDTPLPEAAPENKIEILAEEQQWLEQQWLRTFSQDGITLAWALVLLRLDQMFLKEEFSKNNQMSESSRGHHEKGRQNPNMHNLNKRIEVSALDNEGKPAQLLRLKRENMEPMTLDELRTCEIGTLMRYLRIVKGFTQGRLSKKDALDHPKSNIGFYETNNKDVPEDVIERFISWLNLQSDSALARIIRQKAGDSEYIADDADLQQVLTEQFLLAEHIDQLVPYPISTNDEELRQQLESVGTIQDMVLHICSLLNPKDNGDSEAIDERYLYLAGNVKSGHIPELETIYLLALDLNLDLHNPATQLLLAQAEKEIQQKWRGRTIQ